MRSFFLHITLNLLRNNYCLEIEEFEPLPMAKFKIPNSKSSAQISTASLPDIVFMLLFFFMVTTVMREVTLLVENHKPMASETKKLSNRKLISYIYVGEPLTKYQKNRGKAACIQLNDAFASLDEIAGFIPNEISNIPENQKSLMTVSLKADDQVKMGLITDIKQELRKASALKISYSTRKMLD